LEVIFTGQSVYLPISTLYLPSKLMDLNKISYRKCTLQNEDYISFWSLEIQCLLKDTMSTTLHFLKCIVTVHILGHWHTAKPQYLVISHSVISHIYHPLLNTSCHYLSHIPCMLFPIAQQHQSTRNTPCEKTSNQFSADFVPYVLYSCNKFSASMYKVK
jgi:hypothetical protein